jgi:polyribonucleotide nucleotidyltransferase
VVSEVLESNGSSSMASVCASSLSLMDAGVPIREPVAGVSVGLVYEGPTRYATLTDIQGLEDHAGHMDFKVAGTREGINALHLDMKVQGLPTQVLTEALLQAKDARLEILDLMAQAIGEPRTVLSKYAPRMFMVQINREKIGQLIGPGGKMIRALQADYEVEIDVEDDGTVLVFGKDSEKAEKCRDTIAAMTREVKIGEIFTGKVISTTAFGAFVELLPGQDGLVHISQLAWEHVKKTEDVVKPGDEITVKVIDIDDQGKVRLSRKEMLPRPEGAVDEPEGHSGGSRGSGGRSGGGGDRSGGGRGGAYMRDKKR